MPRLRRTEDQIEGAREARTLAGTLGTQVRRTRRARRITQAQLGQRVGLQQSRISDLERGRGEHASLETWVALGIAFGRPLAVSLSRDIAADTTPRDAGHLRAQELLLGLARRHGRSATFELPTRPADPARSIDVGIRDDRARLLIVVEVWNRLDDLGAAARNQARKVAAANALAAAVGGDEPYAVRGCWTIVDTAANRRLVSAYPEILRSRFPGSSKAWARALADGADPPDMPGLIWADTRSGRLFAVRLSRG